jgi:diguanylate cyclase (GGDEF)-like protein
VKYARFEWLTLGVGGAAILATVLVSLWSGTPIVEELVAQLLLLAVLVGAVHWGRKGGFAAAIGAILLYVAMRAPLIVAEGTGGPIFELIAVRTVTYALVGVIGGEVCGRMKYMFARLEDNLNVDAATQLYNGRFLSRLIANNLGTYARYRTPFSVVVLELQSALTSELRPSRRTSLMRAVANHLRNDVRLVDDVGRVDENTFVLILPHTEKEGATVAAARVRSGLCDLLGARDESVTAEVFGVPDDFSALEALRDRVEQEAVEAEAAIA